MYRLSIDFGTSTTVAMLGSPDGRIRPLLFDASPLLSSAVLAGPDQTLLVGADAQRAAVGAPDAFEANPKRRIDDGVIWLGGREHEVVDVIAAVLRRVGAEAVRVAGRPAERVVLTHPAAWAHTRLGVLAEAASRAGLGEVSFEAEPVAAARYFAGVLRYGSAPGRCVVVYDLGAGTFDVTVVRHGPSGFEVAATDGLTDVGGLDLDAAVVAYAREMTAHATDAWQRLDWPQTPADQRARQTLWQGARAVKEQLSRHTSGDLHLPLIDQQVHLTRQEFEQAARPYLDRTATLTLSVLQTAGVAPETISGVFLVGGSSRVPLASTLLHRTLRIAPTVIDQPELVVAEGAAHYPASQQAPTQPRDSHAGASGEPPPRRPPATGTPESPSSTAARQAAVGNDSQTPPIGPYVAQPGPGLDQRTGAVRPPTTEPAAPDAGSDPSPSRRAAAFAGLAVLIVVAVIAVAVWRPWQSWTPATGNAKDGGASTSTATSGSPTAVLIQYIDAKFNSRNEQRAQGLQCATPHLSTIDDLANDLSSRQSHFGVAITVSTSGIEVTADGATAMVTSDLTLAASANGNIENTTIQHWQFDLVQAGGWRVCSAQRTS